MGYFSEKQIELQDNRSDQSYRGFEDQLLWRYEDLKERYAELSDIGAPFVGDDCFCSDDYRYAPISCFKTIRDILRALEIAKEDLETKYNVTVREDGSVEKKADDEEDPQRITAFEIVLLPTWFQTAMAAA